MGHSRSEYCRTCGAHHSPVHWTPPLIRKPATALPPPAYPLPLPPTPMWPRLTQAAQKTAWMDEAPSTAAPMSQVRRVSARSSFTAADVTNMSGWFVGCFCGSCVRCNAWVYSRIPLRGEYASTPTVVYSVFSGVFPAQTLGIHLGIRVSWRCQKRSPESPDFKRWSWLRFGPSRTSMSPDSTSLVEGGVKLLLADPEGPCAGQQAAAINVRLFGDDMEYVVGHGAGLGRLRRVDGPGKRPVMVDFSSDDGDEGVRAGDQPHFVLFNFEFDVARLAAGPRLTAADLEGHPVDFGNLGP